MKTIAKTFVLILVLSLIFVSNAYQLKRRSNNALREQLLDYLLEAQRRELLYNENELERELARRTESYFDSSSNEDDKRFARRKAVGLSDNPFK